MSIKVLILPRYDAQAASCRHRFLQYIPFLTQQGFECTVSPLFDMVYTREVLRNGRRRTGAAALSLARRLLTILGSRQYDLLVVYAELLPYAPPALEWWLWRSRMPYVLDFDDAFFHRYDRHSSALVRSMLGSKIATVVKYATVNCAGSEYLAEYARHFSERVELVPTVVDITRFPASPPPTAGDRFRIGWIGSPSTTAHLQGVVPELREFCRNRNAEVVAIGARPFETDGLPVRWVEWAEATEVAELARTDVGIMPLPSSEWAAGKCGFKLIQTMACWRPVVASPVGENCRIVEEGVSGFFAADGQWFQALDRLYSSPGLRQQLGIHGRRQIEQRYSLQVWQPRVARLWKDAAATRDRRATAGPEA
jgi:glycosyltransferase involved in cell wall biosynthesis